MHRAVPSAVILITLMIVLIPQAYAQLDARVDPPGTIVTQPIHNPFENNAFAYPAIATNASLLAIGILRYKRKFPHFLEEKLGFIFRFEFSKKTALILLAAAIGIYSAFSIPELYHEENDIGDYSFVKEELQMLVSDPVSSIRGLYFIKHVLLWFSLNILGNIRIVPFLMSISLLMVVYFFAKSLAKKNLAGILSVIVLLPSQLFLKYDTLATYNNSWVLFFILSLYVMSNKWQLSVPSFFLSLFSKGLVAAYVPMMLYFAYKSKLQKRAKIILIASYMVLTWLGAASFLALNPLKPSVPLFLGVVQQFSLELDLFIIALMPAAMVGLFLMARKGSSSSLQVMFLLAGVIWSNFLYIGLTSSTSFQYRHVPVAVFFAIAIGVISSGRATYSNDRNRSALPIFVISLPVSVALFLYTLFPDTGNIIINTLARLMQ